MNDVKLVSISYQQSRLEFFKEQLAAAKRRLNWSVKHNPNWCDHAEKGEVVSFYEWAVQMAEEMSVTCKDCKHSKPYYDCTVTCHLEEADDVILVREDFDYCSYAER